MSRLLDRRRCGEVTEVSPDVGFVHHYRHCVKDFDIRMDCEDLCQDEGLLRYVSATRARARELLRVVGDSDGLTRV